ncbi:hypothetical protein B0T24DRAFT_534588, partial [Lasiosphaeria ovina]
PSNSLMNQFAFATRIYNAQNFMFTDDGKGDLYILDLGHASFLPVSFMAFAGSRRIDRVEDGCR